MVRRHLTYEIRCTREGLDHTFKLVLGEEEGNALLEESNYDYQGIVGKLDIEDGELVLGEGLENSSPKRERPKMAPIESMLPSQMPPQPPRKPAMLNSHISEKNEDESFRVGAEEEEPSRREEEEEVPAHREEDEGQEERGFIPRHESR